MEHPPPVEQPKVSEIQQRILDCSACFASNGKPIGTGDVVDCQSLGETTVRSGFSRLEAKGLTRQIDSDGSQKRNKYEPTDAGIERAVTPEHCATVNRTIPLPTSMQKALECMCCLNAQRLPATRTAIEGCPKNTSAPGTTWRALGDLVKQGYAKRGDQHTYHATKVGLKRATSIPDDDCRAANIEQSSALTRIQRRVRECIGCQAVQGLMPDHQRTALCTEEEAHEVRKAAAVLQAGNMIKIDTDPLHKPGLRGTKPLETYRLLEPHSTEPQLAEGCSWPEKEILEVYERLSPLRKKLVRCLSCIDEKIAAGMPLPGAGAPMLASCTGASSGGIRDFFHQLIESGYYLQDSRGYSSNEYGQFFIRPTGKGRRLLALYRAGVTPANSECSFDIESVQAPIHVRTAVARCLGCIWTKQMVAGNPAFAEAGMVAACTGLDRNTLANQTLPSMATEDYLSIRMNNKNQVYTPNPSSLKIPLEYADGCTATPNTTRLGSRLKALLIQEINSPGMVASAVSKLEISAPDSGVTWRDFFDKLMIDYPLLKAEEEVYLGKIIQTSTNPKMVENAIARLTFSNARLALHAARRYGFAVKMTSYEDVALACLLGVYKAAHTFDPSLGYKFSTHAFFAMTNAATNATAKQLGINRITYRNITAVLAAEHSFQERHQRTPSLTELAQASKKSTNIVSKVFETLRRLESPLKEAPIDDMRSGILRDAKAEAALDTILTQDIFAKIRQHLTPAERDMLDNVIINEQNLYAHADRKGIAITTAHLHYQRLLEKMRHPVFALHATLNQAQAWQESAQCHIENYTAVITDPGHASTDICTRCPTTVACANTKQTASSPPIESGIWGGVRY